MDFSHSLSVDTVSGMFADRDAEGLPESKYILRPAL